jgi:hypothetical protein
MDKDKMAFYILGGIMAFCLLAVVNIVSIAFLFWH